MNVTSTLKMSFFLLNITVRYSSIIIGPRENERNVNLKITCTGTQAQLHARNELMSATQVNASKAKETVVCPGRACLWQHWQKLVAWIQLGIGMHRVPNGGGGLGEEGTTSRKLNMWGPQSACFMGAWLPTHVHMPMHLGAWMLLVKMRQACTIAHVT